MRNKNVLVIFCDADLYGASKVLVRSLEAFRRIGLTPITILPHHGPLVPIIEDLGFEIIFINHGVLRKKNMNLRGIFSLFKELVSSFFKLSSLIRKRKISLIYSNSYANVIGGLLKFRFGLPHIWHVHEITKRPFWFKVAIEQYIKMTGDAIFCVSRAVMENFPQIPSRLLKLLYNGIDTSSYQNVYYDLRTEIGVSPSTRIIGMIARVNLWKGQFYFLEIASMLKDKYPDLHFVMAGDAYPGYEFLYDDLEEAIRERGLEGAVTNLKFRQDVPELLSAMDIFVLPSILPDPLPTTVLEAMAAAKPVVATNHGGATEMVIDGDTGMLIPFDDVKRSFEVISGLLDSKELITKMGEAGKARVKQFFDKEKYLENFGKLVKQVIQTNQE